MSEANPYNAVVAAIPLDDGEVLAEKGDEVEDVWEIILNIGINDGVAVGQHFLIFSLGPEIKDPISGESLGHYELVRGKSKVVHLQERMCTVRSARTKFVLNTNPFAIASGSQANQYREQSIPFSLAAVGDLARRV